MLFKSLEFKNADGQKVKVMEIPVLEEDNTYHFLINTRLETYLSKIYSTHSNKKVYSFREYLKKRLKWQDYEQIFEIDILKHNA